MGGRRLRSATAFTQRHSAGLAAAEGPGPNQGPEPNQSADALAGARNSTASAHPRTPIRDIALFPEARIVPKDNIAILTACQRMARRLGLSPFEGPLLGCGAGGVDPVAGADLGGPDSHANRLLLDDFLLSHFLLSDTFVAAQLTAWRNHAG